MDDRRAISSITSKRDRDERRFAPARDRVYFVVQLLLLSARDSARDGHRIPAVLSIESFSRVCASC